MRLFIAVLFSDEVKEGLSHTIQNLKKQTASGRFTQKDNLHLTLAFIGETSRIVQAKETLSTLIGEPFPLIVDGMGCFPRDNGDIYWAGIQKNPALEMLAGQVSAGLKKQGFQISDRKFQPHLTLGREIIPQKGFDLGAFGRALPRLEMQVEKVSLMKSERINGKLVYTEIASKRLTKEDT